MRSTCDLSLVFACYNEAEHFEQSMRRVVDVLDDTRLSYEIIFVDDCSKDATPRLIAQLKRDYPEKDITTLFHTENTGRGRTVSDGFRVAKGEIVGYIDADLEVEPHYIPSCVRAIREGADAAYALRTYKLHPTLFHRHILSRGYSMLVQRLLNIELSDTESGYKFFRRDLLLPILEQTVDPGWFWDTELMTRWLLAGHTVAEIPALFIRRNDKTSTVRVFHDTSEYLTKLVHFRSVVQQIKRGQADNSRVRVPTIYARPALYQLLTRLLYGEHLHDRYAAIAAEIPARSHVVDVCMGDGELYLKCLRNKETTYLGLDRSPAMVDWARKRGIEARQFDVRSADPPECDVAVIQGSLYQFLPDPRPVMDKLLHAARHKVIVSEPVVNFSTSTNPLLSTLSRYLTNPDLSEPVTGNRFNQASLDAFFRSFNSFQGSRQIAGGRECMGVFLGQRRT